MNFSNLKNEYKDFLCYIFLAQESLENLVSLHEKFLQRYCKKMDYDKVFAEKLEENLIHLEMLNIKIDELFEYIECISLLDLEFPKIKKKSTKHSARKSLAGDESLFVNLNKCSIKFNSN